MFLPTKIFVSCGHFCLERGSPDSTLMGVFSKQIDTGDLVFGLINMCYGDKLDVCDRPIQDLKTEMFFQKQPFCTERMELF